MVAIERQQNKAVVKVYAPVGGWDFDGANFSAILSQLEGQYKDIDIRMHSYGGSCMEGNVIYNAIANSKANITIYVDGIAASMASIILMAAKKVVIAQNGFIMIHRPSAIVDGDVNDLTGIAKLLRSMEADFKRKYSEKTGKPISEVSAWFDGADHWFDAQEALELKLVDEISGQISSDALLEKQTAISLGIDNLYNRFTALVKSENHQNQKNMNKAQLIAHYGLKGVTPESSDADIIAAIDAKIAEANAAKATAENALKEQKTAQITAEIDVLKDKITAKQREEFAKIGEAAGLDALRMALEPYKKQVTLTSMIGGGAANGQPGRESWSWDDWQTKDPRGLEAMATANPEGFDALRKAKYNV